jgi:hypothetical protein
MLVRLIALKRGSPDGRRLASGGNRLVSNDDPSLPWAQTATFGTALGAVDGCSLIWRAILEYEQQV